MTWAASWRATSSASGLFVVWTSSFTSRSSAAERSTGVPSSFAKTAALARPAPIFSFTKSPTRIPRAASFWLPSGRVTLTRSDMAVWYPYATFIYVFIQGFISGAHCRSSQEAIVQPATGARADGGVGCGSSTWCRSVRGLAELPNPLSTVPASSGPAFGLGRRWNRWPLARRCAGRASGAHPTLHRRRERGAPRPAQQSVRVKEPSSAVNTAAARLAAASQSSAARRSAPRR